MGCSKSAARDARGRAALPEVPTVPPGSSCSSCDGGLQPSIVGVALAAAPDPVAVGASPLPLAGAGVAVGVVLDCANIGHRYAEYVVGAQRPFDWEGVRRAVGYYNAKGVGTIAICKAGTVLRNPLPDDLKSAVSVSPDAQHRLGKDVDDLYIITVARRHGCQFVSDDSYVDWICGRHAGQLEEHVREWLEANDGRLHVSYMFHPDGAFEPEKSPRRALQVPLLPSREPSPSAPATGASADRNLTLGATQQSPLPDQQPAGVPLSCVGPTVPAAIVGKLIGPRGTRIRELEKRASCKITITPDEPAALSGTPAAQVRARELLEEWLRVEALDTESVVVLERLGECPVSSLIAELPSIAQLCGHARDALEQLPSIEPYERTPGEVWVRVRGTGPVIPSALVGRLIGQGGSAVRALEERTGCSITVRGDKPVLLRGAPHTQERARVLLDEWLAVQPQTTRRSRFPSSQPTRRRSRSSSPQARTRCSRSSTPQPRRMPNIHTKNSTARGTFSVEGSKRQQRDDCNQQLH